MILNSRQKKNNFYFEGFYFIQNCRCRASTELFQLSHDCLLVLANRCLHGRSKQSTPKQIGKKARMYVPMLISSVTVRVYKAREIPHKDVFSANNARTLNG